MSHQNILTSGFNGLDVVIDYSETYDFMLCDLIPTKIECKLDFSIVYDFTIGNSSRDYILYETFEIISDCYILTEDGFVIETQNEHYLLYM